MASNDVQYKTLMLLTGVVAAALILTILFASEQSSDMRLFIVALNTIIVSINVIGVLLIWSKGDTLVDEIFVMTPSGMLLKHYTRRLRPDQDENILAGMLTAVQNFIRDSFEEGGGRLNEIRFEKYDIMISYSINVVIAAVISTRNPQKLRDKLAAAAREIEQLYGQRLRDWNGDTSELKHIDNVMKGIIGRL